MRTMSQTLDALLNLRELILDGSLAAGQRVSEPILADRLGVSRTPVRAALARLAEEGLLETLPHGGYAVVSISEAEVRIAIEIRGVLEGLAAGLAARRGARGEALEELRDSVGAIDAIVGPAGLPRERFEDYVQLNERVHAAIVDLADSPGLKRQIARAAALPFASPSGFIMAEATGEDVLVSLGIAQAQHRAVLEAIEDRDAGRAEAVMREHARLAQSNLERAMTDHQAMRQVRGANLIDLKSAPGRRV